MSRGKDANHGKYVSMMQLHCPSAATRIAWGNPLARSEGTSQQYRCTKCKSTNHERVKES